MKGILKNIWKAYGVMGDILTAKGTLLAVFLGIFFHKAHQETHGADIWDGLKAFYQPVIEHPETIIPGIGYFLADVFNLAVDLTTDYFLPGASFVLKNAFAAAASTNTPAAPDFPYDL